MSKSAFGQGGGWSGGPWTQVAGAELMEHNITKTCRL